MIYRKLAISCREQRFSGKLGNSTFTMSGGTIEQNEDSEVTLYNSSFTMSGGTIKNNNASGAVNVYESSFTKTGPSIISNNAGYDLSAYPKKEPAASPQRKTFPLCGMWIKTNSIIRVPGILNSAEYRLDTISLWFFSGRSTGGIRHV